MRARPASDPSVTSPEPPDPFPTPLATVDVAIFSVQGGRLQVLLIDRAAAPEQGRAALPGGFVHVGEDADLESAARRILRAKTGVGTPYLEQVRSVGNATRDPRGWSLTVVFFALLPAADSALPGARWAAVVGETVAEPLAFDHAELLGAAVRRLRNKVEYTALPVHLLPEEFTLSDLQDMFEIILGRAVNKSAFRRRIQDSKILVPLRGRLRKGSNRPAQLYRLREGTDAHLFPRMLGT